LRKGFIKRWPDIVSHAAQTLANHCGLHCVMTQKATALFQQSQFWIGCGTLSSVICIAAVKRRLDCDRSKIALNQRKLEDIQSLLTLSNEVQVYERALASVKSDLQDSAAASRWAGCLRLSVSNILNGLCKQE
jgi:hypothetical protein